MILCTAYKEETPILAFRRERRIFCDEKRRKWPPQTQKKIADTQNILQFWTSFRQLYEHK